MPKITDGHVLHSELERVHRYFYKNQVGHMYVLYSMYRKMSYLRYLVGNSKTARKSMGSFT